MKYGLLNALRQSLFKEMHRIEVPINFNEPLSALHRIAAMFEYSEILAEASQAEEAERRISLVACFIIS